MDEPIEALTAYAAEVAPHVDRLAIAVHKHGRPAAQEVLRGFGLSGAGVLIDARAALLAEPITLDDLTVIARYAPRAALSAALDEHVRQGLLTRDDAGTPSYACTMRGRDLLLRLTELQGQTITVLWAVRAAELPALAAAATRIGDRAAAVLPLDLYPAFRGQHAAPAPLGGTPAHLLLTRLTTLRYLRADAHTLALEAHGLEGTQAHVLTALWRAAEPLAPRDITGEPDAVDAALAALLRDGFAEGDGDHWRLTPAGRRRRDEIEAETNRAAAPPFAALDAAERGAFALGLANLPD